MFSSIVVGTDGSLDAQEAVKAAGHLASVAPGGTVHVVTAYDPLTTTELQRLDDDLPSEFDDQITGDLLARSAIEGAAGVLTALGIDHTARESKRAPSDAILARAHEVHADTIVVGSRGEGPLDRLRHGSTSTKVIHEAPCNVLVVKHRS